MDLDDATRLIADAGAAELEAMSANATAASSEPWPAPYRFSNGASFRKSS